MGASDRERDEAGAVAAILNQVCNATLAALQPESDPELRAGLAAELEELRAALDEVPAVRRFVQTLIGWLRGTRPDARAMQRLDPPFRRALQTLLEQVPEEAVARPVSSLELLARTTAAVVAAVGEGSPDTRRALAVQLLNLGQRLPAEARPLLENLRALLGNVPPEQLPPIAGEPYEQLWLSVRLLLDAGHDFSEQARAALLDRLVHNTAFALRAGLPELTQALVAALADLQRQALDARQADLAGFILALRLRLEGHDTVGLVEGLGEPYTSAWRRLPRSTEP